MVARRRAQSSRHHGTRLHGRGGKRKQRGAGNRGGRGMAGTGKRGGSRRPSIWRDLTYFGKYGFTKPTLRQRSITLSLLEESMPRLVEAGLASKEKDAYVIDLIKLGYDKLLSKGKLGLKLKVKARYASHGAVEKVEAAGGEVTVTEVPQIGSPESKAGAGEESGAKE